MSGEPKRPLEPKTPEKPSALIIFPKDGVVTTSDEQINELQEQISEVKDKANEDRFLFFLVAVIVFNVFAFKYLGSVGMALIITFFEAILLLVLSKRFGVEEPQVWLSALMRACLDRVDKK
jgi:hypothetical protein